MRANVEISSGIAGRVTITFPYDPAHVAKIKAIEGSRWHPKEKYWSAPRSDGILEKNPIGFCRATNRNRPSPAILRV